MKHIGVVIQSYAQSGLRCEVVSLLEGIYQNVHQGINHEHAQKRQRRYQVDITLKLRQKRLAGLLRSLIIFHNPPRLSLKHNSVLSLFVKQIHLVRLQIKLHGFSICVNVVLSADNRADGDIFAGIMLTHNACVPSHDLHSL